MTNELQTWTRKANAEAAVKKALADASAHIFIDAIEAADIGVGDKKEFAVKVTLDNTPAEAADLIEALGKKAEVICLRSDEESVTVTEAPVENVADEDEADIAAKVEADNEAEEAPGDLFSALATKPKRKPSNGNGSRRPSKKGERYTLKVADAANPYRPGSQSHAAFELLRSNPGITREEFVAKGGRARTLSEDIRHDRVNVQAPE